jgi:hypothetical protein
MPLVAQWRSREWVNQLATRPQRRKRIRKLCANKLRKKERAAYVRYLHARGGLHMKMGPYAHEGLWRRGNWDFNLNSQLPA